MTPITDEGLIVRFEGAEADNHIMDMRQLGTSLLGFERLVTVGLFVLDRGEAPKRNELLPLKVRASEPRHGSFEFAMFLDWARTPCPY